MVRFFCVCQKCSLWSINTWSTSIIDITWCIVFIRTNLIARVYHVRILEHVVGDLSDAVNYVYSETFFCWSLEVYFSLSLSLEKQTNSKFCVTLLISLSSEIMLIYDNNCMVIGWYYLKDRKREWETMLARLVLAITINNLSIKTKKHWQWICKPILLKITGLRFLFPTTTCSIHVKFSVYYTIQITNLSRPKKKRPIMEANKYLTEGIIVETSSIHSISIQNPM